MPLTDLIRLPLEGGSYISPEPSPSLLARLWPTLSFYIDTLFEVRKTNILAKAGKLDMEILQRKFMQIMQAIEDTGGRMEITGFEHILSLQGPCVFVGNHMSTLETFILPGIIGPFHPLTFVVKESLTTYPFFGAIMLYTKPITVSRKNPRADLKTVLDEGLQNIENGRSVIVFPQSTRTTLFDPEQFNTIGIKLAKRAGVPVVPLALKTDFWRTGKIIRDLGRIVPSRTVHFAFGPPMEVEGRGTEVHQYVLDFIRDHLEKWSTPPR